MTTDENILMEMLERVTNPAKENIDNLASQMFCMIVQSNIDLVTKAHELIVHKMYSNNTTVALKAIGLLEECMSKAGSEFQKKTAKFSFLNQLIALVLDRHDGTPAPVEIKKRIMDCLMLWSVEHQDKVKIQEAYENLKKQINFENDPATANSTSPALANTREQHSTILGKDDQLVAKLLKQGGAENYKKANLLIQKRVNQEARRTEFICHLKSELKKIENTMEVLDEMLTSYTPDACEADNRDIMLELYNTCKGHNIQMARWPDFLGDAEPSFLEDVLNTKELLMVTIQRYKEVFANELSCSLSENIRTTTNTDLLSQLLADTLTTSNQETKPIKPESRMKASNTLDELNEIFGSIIDNDEVNKTQHPADLYSNLDMLEPISVFKSKINDMPPATTVFSPSKPIENEEKKAQGYKELREIDKLSEEMFKQSLKEEQRLLSFKKETEKLTLNDIAKDRMQTVLHTTKNPEGQSKKSLEFSEKNEKFKNSDNLILDVEENKAESLNKIDIQEKVCKDKNDLEDKNRCECPKLSTLKPLAEISIDLDEVTPLDEGQRLLLDDDDIQVTLHFTADRPSEHVSVIVMTVTNKSKFPVKDFQFEASVRKPCKVRLLPPTDVAMAPRKPFRPPSPINQVILLLNPTQKPVDITCIVGYKLGDDPDPIKESIVTKDIPFV